MVGAAEIRNLISTLPTVVDEIEVDDIMKEADPGETGQACACRHLSLPTQTEDSLTLNHRTLLQSVAPAG